MKHPQLLSKPGSDVLQLHIFFGKIMVKIEELLIGELLLEIVRLDIGEAMAGRSTG